MGSREIKEAGVLPRRKGRRRMSRSQEICAEVFSGEGSGPPLLTPPKNNQNK